MGPFPTALPPVPQGAYGIGCLVTVSPTRIEGRLGQTRPTPAEATCTRRALLQLSDAPRCLLGIQCNNVAETGICRGPCKDGRRMLYLRPQAYAVRVRRAVSVARKREKTSTT